MVNPLLALRIAGIAGLGISTASNLYTQRNQRRLYSAQNKAYMNLHNGYQKYLSNHGRSVNPDRAWTSYYGKAQQASNNYTNSIAGSIGTVGGALGAGSVMLRGLYGSDSGRTSKRL